MAPYDDSLPQQQLADMMAAYRAQHRPRVRCQKPLSRAQIVIAAMLSDGLEPDAIADRLDVKRRTIDFHIWQASKRIPGDLAAASKMKAWYRGATMDILAPRERR